MLHPITIASTISSHHLNDKINFEKVKKEGDNNSIQAKNDCDDGLAGRWTSEEHKKFLKAIELFGRNWKKVHEYIGSRTATQARSHAQKYFAKLARDSSFTKNESESQAVTASNSPAFKPDDEEPKATKRRPINILEDPKEICKSKVIASSHEMINTKDPSIFNNSLPTQKYLCQPAYPTIRKQSDFEFDDVYLEPIEPLDLNSKPILPIVKVSEETQIFIDFSSIF